MVKSNAQLKRFASRYSTVNEVDGDSVGVYWEREFNYISVSRKFGDNRNCGKYVTIKFIDGFIRIDNYYGCHGKGFILNDIGEITLSYIIDELNRLNDYKDINVFLLSVARNDGVEF